jgi:hypothetical protein
MNSSRPIKRIAIVDCGHPAHVANGVLKLLADDYEFEKLTSYESNYSTIKGLDDNPISNRLMTSKLSI